MTEAPASPASLGGRILRASAAIFAAHLCLKLLSPIQYKLIGHYSADPLTRDLFVFGFEGVLGTLYLVGEEALGPALLPVFMSEKDHQSEASAWRFGGAVLTVQFFLLLAAVAVTMLWPEAWVNLLTDWTRTAAEPERAALATRYARWLAPGLVCLSLGSATYMLLNGYKRFFLAAFGDASAKLGIIVCLAVSALAGATLDGVTALRVFAAGALLGGMAKLATHLLGLRRELKFLRPNLDMRSPAFREFAWLVLPLLAGIVFAKVRDGFNNIWVLSHLEPGLLADGAWGRKLHQTLGHLVPYAVSIAMLPFFCELAHAGRREELGRLINRSARIIVLLCAPLGALVMALALPLARVLFQGGHYQYESCLNAATASAGYALVLPFFALEYVLMQAFFANRRMLSVTLIGMFFSTLSMVLSYWLVIVWGWRGAAALGGVAAAFTVSRALKVCALAVWLRRFVPCFAAGETISFLGRIVIISTLTGGAAWGVRRLYEQLVEVRAGRAVGAVVRVVGPELLLAGSAGLLAASLGAWLFCRSDLRETGHWLAERLRRRAAK